MTGCAILTLFMAAMLLLLYLRAFKLNYAYFVFQCDHCVAGYVILHDAPLLCAILALFTVSFLFRSALLRLLLRILALGGLLVYGLDIAVSQQFFTRLHFSDILIYATQPDIVLGHIGRTGILPGPPALWGVITGILLLTIVCWPALTRCRRGWYLLTAAAILIGGISLLIPARYHWSLINVVAANWKDSSRTPYSETFKQTMLAAPETPHCIPGRHTRDNYIILIMESWSYSDSKLFSDIHDWTPRIDQIARDNTWFSHFYASGFSTNNGLMALLAGIEVGIPTVMPNSGLGKPHDTPFIYWNIERTLPSLLNARGYATSFLTTGDLSFTSKDKWLQNIGFSHVEGHEHPFYNGMPRMGFDAAPDSALYARVIQHADELRRQGTPFLIAVENVSTHNPFIHPVTEERGKEAVTRYMDDTVADFYQALKQSGFFEHGKLLIVSDHRAMEFVTKEEYQTLGRSAMSRIPAVWVGHDIPRGRMDTVFHQADLIDTIDYNTAEKYCSAHGLHNMFDTTHNTPRCVFHGRGDDRSLVDVFCDQGEGTIQLDGDHTRMIESENLSAAEADALVQQLNRYRIRMEPMMQ